MTPALPLKLIRLEQNEHATFGLLQDAESKKLGVTLELPWKNNAHNVSCIPPGSYTLKRRWSNKHQREVFGIEGVPDRADIEIHPANFTSDLLGCVGIGTDFQTFHGERGIGQSRLAFEAFMKAMDGVNEAGLDVMDPFPVAA